MIIINMHNVADETTFTSTWRDENSAKAFMFDLTFSREYDYLEYLNIEIDEENKEYTVHFIQ